MRTHHLPNYLRAHRKRSGLSQDDIAYLLGHRTAAHLSRFERFRRSPGFRLALALWVIFQLPPHELFRGEYHKVERVIRQRAKRLATRLAAKSQDERTLRKVAFLNKIGSRGHSR